MPRFDCNKRSDSVIQVCENWLGGLDQVGIRALRAIITQPSSVGIG
jgi:hypothetical protein